MRTERWTVLVNISEHSDHTSADARLHSRDDIAGRGLARRNPSDTDIPEIGAELATSRALSDLAHQLLDASIADVEQATSHPATFRS
ncbi:DUF1876 domain-containing protein [Saccharopolyspora gloriosae]|uniref:DUF1876 domain-containing protein n=1 Tax=Saccharopolyspora gloriosae TaxID=455344 RepID=A0A840NEG1_9PSEU|nr:DUF1876 domain-containing protein [Saccharopolyspora gloriosae]MBB5069994.1 hypothetical protein [Saccharopolyspora gloriosae]